MNDHCSEDRRDNFPPILIFFKSIKNICSKERRKNTTFRYPSFLLVYCMYSILSLSGGTCRTKKNILRTIDFKTKKKNKEQ